MAEAENQVYLRNQDGVCEYASVREGVEKFLSDEGYRISFFVDGVKFTIRKGVVLEPDTAGVDELIGQSSVDAMVTIYDERRQGR